MVNELKVSGQFSPNSARRKCALHQALQHTAARARKVLQLKPDSSLYFAKTCDGLRRYARRCEALPNGRYNTRIKDSYLKLNFATTELQPKTLIAINFENSHFFNLF
jgi:hypothetical protein